MSALPGTCVVVPCYDEAERLRADEFAAFAAQHPWVRLLFVDDGSTDRTRTILEDLVARDPDRLRLVVQPENRGKAEAVRTGVLAALERGGCELVGYLDSDLATPLDEIARLAAEAVEHPGVDLFIASRVNQLGSDVRRGLARHYLGRVFATAVSCTLRLSVYDSQCGCKLVRAAVARQLFDTPFVSRWLFDVELLARCIERFGRDGARRRIREVGVRRWHEVPGSKVRWWDFARAPGQLWRIRRAYRL